MEPCQIEGCQKFVSKSGHAFCLVHWKAERAGTVVECKTCKRWHENDGPFCKACKAKSPVGLEPSSQGASLTSTRIGEHFSMSNVKTNLILAELGWLEKYVKGWIPTDRGNALGVNIKESNKGVPYVVWPESILTNTALLASITEQSGPRAVPVIEPVTEPVTGPITGTSRATVPNSKPNTTRAAKSDWTKPDDFRTKFPANFRTQDGHMVRSRAEVLIDNWLYMQGIVHAYERRLPIEEDCYCDFYLPGSKGVYIEFWGMESDPQLGQRYRDRMAMKQAIYAKHELRLIELGDAEIERLDDVLQKMLLRFGIESA